MLLLATALFLSLHQGDGARDIHDVCSIGLQKCLDMYINDVTQHTTDREICHDVGMFVGCILDLECDLSKDVKMQSFHTVEVGLAQKGLKCDKITKMKAIYLSGISEPPNSRGYNSMSRSNPRATLSESRPEHKVITSPPSEATTQPNCAVRNLELLSLCLPALLFILKSLIYSLS